MAHTQVQADVDACEVGGSAGGCCLRCGFSDRSDGFTCDVTVSNHETSVCLVCNTFDGSRCDVLREFFICV